MRYFKIEKSPRKIFGDYALSRNRDKIGISFSGDNQMITNDKHLTYGKIINEVLFANANFDLDDFIFFDTLEEVQADIDLEYIEKLVLDDPLKLQLDMQLSKKTDIKDYDSNLTIDSQFNLQKIKDENMGGVKVATKKAKME